MKNHAEIARENFFKGYNCSQSVLLAYADELGLDKETALKIASSFGAGMGRLREVCGSVSGMFMVAGLAKGYSQPGDLDAKRDHYAFIQKLAHEFQEQNGSIVCRELLGLDHKEDDPTPQARTESYYKKRPCADCIASAARIIEKYL